MDTPAATTLPPRISVTAPVTTALDWTGRVLFRSFDLRKWFVLGFCAWLAWIGQNFGGGGNGSRISDHASTYFDPVSSWIEEHWTLVIVLVAVIFVLGIALGILFTWLSSRGQLMFLDGVVHDRGAVVEPWERFRELGNSLFVFRLIVTLVVVAVVVLLTAPLALGVYFLHDDLQDPGMATIGLFVIWLALLIPVCVLALLINVAIHDIVVPIQWLRGCRAREAWAECRALVSRHLGTFVLYALMKLLLGIVTFVISCVATCLTCCIAALPYIGVVILLPLYVFGRSYSMHFLSQFDPAYAALAPAESPAPPAS